MAMSSLPPPALGLFRGERALVTGSASSIGRGIALALAREGAEVLLADIDERRNAETAAAISAAGGTATTIRVDLSTAEGWRAGVAAAIAAPLHMFVHSASPPRHERDHVKAVAPDTFDAMHDTNVRSGFLMGRDIAQAMQGAGIEGRLLFITSLHAGSPRNLPHYSIAKAGMRMAVMELARAYAPAGIRVNALAPGAVPGGGASNIGDDFKAKIPMRRVGTPADMAASAVALLSNRFTPYVTGTTLAVDGGLALFNWIPFASD
jgi:NAD(P)-dependent dehydrogenase (short-subunit alcohol dehydrogenase family)